MDALYGPDASRAVHHVSRGDSAPAFRALAMVDGSADPHRLSSALAAGAQGLWLVVAPADGLLPSVPWPGSVPLRLADDDAWWTLLGTPELSGCSLTVDAGHGTAAAAEGLLRLLEARHIQAREQALLFAADPYSPMLASDDRSAEALTRAEQQRHALLLGCRDELPLARTVALSSAVAQDLGAQAATELAYLALAQIHTWRTLRAQGHQVDLIAARAHITISAEGDLLTCIAKVRAARAIAARIHAAFGGTPTPIPLRVRASWRTLTARDPDTNMLRLASHAAGGVLGGADELALLPYDLPTPTGDGEGHRFATTALRVLSEEAALGRIDDPFAGSYALESVTGELAEAAWQRMQSIEAAGGLVPALLDGAVREACLRDEAARVEARSEGKRPQIGVDLFPREDEEDIPRNDASDEGLWWQLLRGSA